MADSTTPPPPVAHNETVSLKLDLPDVFAFNQDETKTPSARVAGTPEQPVKQLRGTVLLVESDEEVCRLLSRLLQHEGFDLLKASCLNEAREMLKQVSVDFLLARRTSVPRNLQTEIALRDVEAKCTVRIVDEFSDLMLGQVVDYEGMAQCTLGLMDLLVSLVEGANLGARGHSHNVAKYCRLVGQRLGMSRRDLDALTLTSYLHDLGALETQKKIGEIILGKTELLPPSLRPTLDLLANISFPYPVNDLLSATTDVPQPDAPAAENNPPPPLGARVLRVIDTYETLRRNKKELEDEDMLFDWLRKQPSGVFDLDVLETLIHIRKHERAISAMNIFWAAVLIVDPNPEEVQLLKLRLENDDFHVHAASTIEEALHKLRTENITLVLSEYGLANKTTGFELLRTLKNDPGLRHVPVVFHAQGDTDLIRQALELGAEDWYPKPHNVEIIAMKLHRIINRLNAGPAAASDGVQGSLREMGIVEMVQILSTGGRSVVIVLEQSNQFGELTMEKGQLISASKGDLNGNAAALELLKWHDGRFRILALKKKPQPNVTASTDSLLLESCIRQDLKFQQATHPTEPN